MSGGDWMDMFRAAAAGDLDVLENEGLTPMEAALRSGLHDVVDRLRDLGAH